MSSFAARCATRARCISPVTPIHHPNFEYSIYPMPGEFSMKRRSAAWARGRVEMATCIGDYKRERPQSSLVYENPSAVAASIDRRRSTSRIKVSSTAPAIATTTLPLNNTVKLTLVRGQLEINLCHKMSLYQ